MMSTRFESSTSYECGLCSIISFPVSWGILRSGFAYVPKIMMVWTIPSLEYQDNEISRE